MLHFQDGFALYGGGSGSPTSAVAPDGSEEGRQRMLNGLYATVGSNCYPFIPSDEAEANYALKLENSIAGTNSRVRRVLRSAEAVIIAAARVRFPHGLPIGSGVEVFRFLDGGSSALAYIEVNTDGSLTARDSGGTALGTSNPAILSDTWQHLECKVTIGAGTGAIEVRLNGDSVSPLLNLTGEDLGTTPISQIEYRNRQNTVGNFMLLRDVSVCDDSGLYNNNFRGDLAVATLLLDTDVDLQWAPHYRKKFGNGIFENPSSDGDGASCADAAALELGSGDFTFEAWVRFAQLPTGSNMAEIAGKWQESGDERSWQLFLGGPSLEDGDLVFRVSTDGAAGTVTNIHKWPWEPEVGRWYHVAVSRDTAVNSLFIDGVQLGAGVSDSNTYYDGTANLTLGCEMSSASVVVGDSSLYGWLDEVRLTVGSSRYTDEFTPPSAAFPRSVGEGDADFANVQLLAGFDSSLADESSAGRTITARGDAGVFTVDDGDFGYQALDQVGPRDDTFVSADFTAASTVLSLSANPSNGEAVTLGAQTYTLESSFSDTQDAVLIGGDAEETIDNLVAAITGDTGEGTVYGTGTLANTSVTAAALPGDQMGVTALAAGAAGNSIACTETLSNGEFPDTTLDGGADIPSASEFGFQSLPPDATIMRSITLVTRAFKSDAGICDMVTSFVTESDDAADGASNSLSTAPSYHEDIIEEDPTTTVQVNVSSLVNAKLRINRTS